jgi:hypothetical protein
MYVCPIKVKIHISLDYIIIQVHRFDDIIHFHHRNLTSDLVTKFEVTGPGTPQP